MEINLEKIELVKDRTGCTYAEAKEALEKAEGSVVDAIIAVEGSITKDYSKVDGASLKDSPIFAKIKEIIDKGNVSKILIKKDGHNVVNFPLTAGVIGALLVPWGAIFGIVAALGTKCDISFVNDKGEEIDINGRVLGIYDKAKEVAQKGVDKINEADKNGKVDEVLNSIEKAAKTASDKISEIDKDGKIDDVMKSIENVAKTASDKVKALVDEVAEKYMSDEGDPVKTDTETEEFKAAAEEEFKNEEEL